jgi:hypothetical protein
MARNDDIFFSFSHPVASQFACATLIPIPAARRAGQGLRRNQARGRAGGNATLPPQPTKTLQIILRYDVVLLSDRLRIRIVILGN